MVVTFRARHEHAQPRGVCLGQYCTICVPISQLDQMHCSVQTNFPATHHLYHFFPICLQFSPYAVARFPAIENHAQYDFIEVSNTL